MGDAAVGAEPLRREEGPDSVLSRQLAVCATELLDWLATESGDTRQGLPRPTGTSLCSFPSKIRQVWSVWKPKGESVLLPRTERSSRGQSLGAASSPRTAPGVLGRPWPGCSPCRAVRGLTSFPVSRATGACSTCAGAAARSKRPRRLRTAQVSGLAARAPPLAPASRAPWPPEPVRCLCQVTDCFLKPNWRSLWPGRGPSLGFQTLSRPDPGSPLVSLRLWAVPWPEERGHLTHGPCGPRTAAGE